MYNFSSILIETSAQFILFTTCQEQNFSCGKSSSVLYVKSIAYYAFVKDSVWRYSVDNSYIKGTWSYIVHHVLGYFFIDKSSHYGSSNAKVNKVVLNSFWGLLIIPIKAAKLRREHEKPRREKKIHDGGFLFFFITNYRNYSACEGLRDTIYHLVRNFSFFFSTR